MKFVAILFVLILCSACELNTSSATFIAENNIADSFEVKGIRSFSEFLFFTEKSTNQLITLDQEDHALNIYERPDLSSPYTYLTTVELLPRKFKRSFFKKRVGGKNRFYILDNMKRMYEFDASLTLVDSAIFDYKLPFLGKDFSICHYNSLPLTKLGDTIIAGFYHSKVSGIPAFYEEKSIIEFIIKKRQMTDVKLYVEKPKRYSDYPLTDQSHCFVNNIVYQLYPQFDTIYAYNRSTSKHSKIPINNKDYKVPDFAIDGENHKDMTSYELNNFRYSAIFYNENTGHFILFYYTPVAYIRGRNPTYSDQPRKAVVLDRNLKKIKYLNFSRTYSNHANFFFYDKKGLAMPLFKNKYEYENTWFYIYNF